MPAYEPFPPLSAWSGADSGAFDRQASSLASARRAATAEALAEVERRALRRAAVETGAMEGLYTTDRGFTRTVALSFAAIEAAVLPVKGPDVAALVASQLEAYEHVLDAVTGHRPLDQRTVRELHAITTRHQPSYLVETPAGPQRRPLVAGAYKTAPNNPTRPDGTTFAYAPPDDVVAEMQRLLEEWRSGSEQGADPVTLSAFLHYGFVRVHPFPDGNGRVARQLASVPLYAAARVPFHVFVDQREAYLDALEAADAGRLHRFTGFVLDRALDVMLLAEDELRTQLPGALVEGDDDRRATASWLWEGALDTMGARVLQMAEQELAALLTGMSVPAGLRVEVALRKSERVGPPHAGYRDVDEDASALELSLYFQGQLPAIYTEAFVVQVSRKDDPAFLLTSEHPSAQRPFSVPLRQADRPGTVLRTRLALWAEAAVQRLEDVVQRAAATTSRGVPSPDGQS